MSKITPSSGGPFRGKGPAGFYRDVVREMKHVNWPTRHEATRLTGVVLGVCVLLAVVLTGFSFALEQILKVLGIGGQ